jgi:glycosyltransferase involved in cell wall biosynthesis
MTDPLGESQVLAYLTGIAAAGYAISLFSFEKDLKSRHIGRIRIITDQAGIAWYPLSYTKKPPIFSTLYDLLRLGRALKQLHKIKPIHLVHCRSYITAMVGEHMKRRYGIRFLFDMRGFFPDERVDGGIWNLNSPLYKKIYQFFKKKEQDFFQLADHSICLTHEGKRIIQSWDLPGQPLPITVIPCCADLNLFNPQQFSPEKTAQYRTTLNIPEGYRVMVYLGAVGTWYMLPEMLDFFSVLRQQYPETIFLFVTGTDPRVVLEEARKKCIPEKLLRCIGLPRQEVPNILALADFSIFFIQPYFSKKASSPTKLGELMAMGIPVVCNAGVGDTDQIIRKYEAGILVEGFDTQSYQQAVEALPAMLRADRTKAMAGAEAHFSLERGVGTYLNVYKQILQM